MATSFGIDPALLIVDENELARLRAGLPTRDLRQAGNLQRELENMQENLRQAEESLAKVSRDVVDLLGHLKAVEKANKKLLSTGGIPDSISKRHAEIVDGVRLMQLRESQLTRIVDGLRNNIERFRGEGPAGRLTNGELIDAENERDKALKAAGL